MTYPRLPAVVFFLWRVNMSKVGAVSDSIADALRFHTASTPADLTGHIVIIGGHARLQHYVIALRRQRPNKAIVVVTEDKVCRERGCGDS